MINCVRESQYIGVRHPLISLIIPREIKSIGKILSVMKLDRVDQLNKRSAHDSVNSIGKLLSLQTVSQWRNQSGGARAKFDKHCY